MDLKKVIGKAIDDGIKVGKKVKVFMIDNTIEDIEKAIGISEKKGVPEDKRKEKEE